MKVVSDVRELIANAPPEAYPMKLYGVANSSGEVVVLAAVAATVAAAEGVDPNALFHHPVREVGKLPDAAGLEGLTSVAEYKLANGMNRFELVSVGIPDAEAALFVFRSAHDGCVLAAGVDGMALAKKVSFSESVRSIVCEIRSLSRSPSEPTNSLTAEPQRGASAAATSVFRAGALLSDTESLPDAMAVATKNLRAQMAAAGKRTVAYAPFWPLVLGCPLCAPSEPADLRAKIHRSLLLPQRPFLAAASAWDASRVNFGVERSKDIVVNVHTHVTKKAVTIKDSATAIVSGDYDYWHYRVDGFNDEGWGCAYRSCQSVFSFFRNTGFVAGDVQVPSVPRIQEILYAVDPDKQKKKSFVGSKDWIGSFEVMLVLQYYMPWLECTIQRLDKGLELEENPAIKRLLLVHFQRGGAPVMIGGSSYAHTILGIDVNTNTGEAQYLILDPHYTAAVTDVKTVVGSKGWCGWKQAKKFFQMESWYNLCIPKLPTDPYAM